MQTKLQQSLAAVTAVFAAVAITACATGTAGGPSAEQTAAEAALTGRYSGILMDVGNVLPRTGAERLTVWVDRLTSPEELQSFADAPASARQDALRDALAGLEVGRVRVGHGASYPVSAALAHQGDGGMWHLVLVIARPINIGEVFGGTRSLDYPFSVIELDLPDDGEGSGELNVAARVSFSAAGQVSVEDLAVQPVRILGVDRDRR